MLDKKVLTCDFSGIKPNSLVRDVKTDKVGLCLETSVTCTSLGEGAGESYHPIAVVLMKGKREVYPTHDLALVDEDQIG